MPIQPPLLAPRSNRSTRARINFSEKFAQLLINRLSTNMSDHKAQAKITSFFSKPVVQRTLTTGLVPDRKRKLDDTELEESSAIQVNKKQKITTTHTIETKTSLDDETITRNTLHNNHNGSSKMSGKITAVPLNKNTHNEKQQSPPSSIKPALNRAQTVSGSTTFASIRKAVEQSPRVKVRRAVTWRTTQMHEDHPGVTLVVAMGDLTHEQCDVIVNAANSALAHGGGVAGAISRAAGPVLDRESREWVREHGRVEPGQVAVTSAGQLRTIKHVIHAVGPLWEGRVLHGEHEADEYDIDDRTLAVQYEEDEVLRDTVQHSLTAADELTAASIALPAISSGIFGYPKRRCAAVLVSAAIAYIEAHPLTALREIRFTNFDRPTVEIFLDEFNEVFGPA